MYGHQSNCSPNITIGHWKSRNNQPLKTFLSGTSSVFTALLWTGLREIENIILEKYVHMLALSKCFARVPGCMSRWINVNYLTQVHLSSVVWRDLQHLGLYRNVSARFSVEQAHATAMCSVVLMLISEVGLLLLLPLCQHVFTFLWGIVTQDLLFAARGVWTSAFLFGNRGIQRHSEPYTLSSTHWPISLNQYRTKRQQNTIQNPYKIHVSAKSTVQMSV